MSSATRSRLRAGVVVLAVIAVVAGSAGPVNAGQNDADHGVHIRVLSSRPDQVTGGNALVAVQVPSDVPLSSITLLRNGSDVTGELHADGGSLVGLVDGLELGRNTLVASASGVRGRPSVSLTLTDFPVSGPIFSGPQQQPFVCKTEQSGLGQPLVDNQNHTGLPVFALDANGNKTTQIVGWSSNCATTTRVVYL